MEITIADMKMDDWKAVRDIYRQGIETGNATFETDVPDWVVWDRNHRADCRLIIRSQDRSVGWAALSPVSQRTVYSGVAEVSVYVAKEVRNRGIGKALLSALVMAAENAGIWTLQAGIFPENKASIALHLRCGFRKVGCRKRIGQLHGTWRDVILMERRSLVVGI